MTPKITGKSKKITAKKPNTPKFGAKSAAKAAEALKKGGIGVLPTDTLYGLVGPALSEKAVNKIYQIRHRQLNKPMIILIGSQNDLDHFEIKTGGRTGAVLKRFWPGKVSIVLSCPHEKFAYLHRGTGTLAFRLPRPFWLRDFLQKTGPLVAPTANPEGLAPAASVREAKKYFGGKIDFYLDNGIMAGRPSKLVKMEGDKIIFLRR